MADAVEVTPLVTPEQRANLEKLASYLEALPTDYGQFEMTTYAVGDLPSARAHALSCGTAGCAVGHGPLASIAPMGDEDWFEYSTRAFVSHDEEGCAWDWCFGYEWAAVDNTPHGAAARIRWFLERGVPDDFDEQLSGDEPLCYRAEAA